MPTTLRKMGSTAVLEVEGRLLLGNAVDEFRAKWSDALATGARDLVVNLARVPMVDSSGIGSLIRCHSAVTGAGGKLLLAGASDIVLQALHVTRLDQVLQLHPDEEAALAVLEGAER